MSHVEFITSLTRRVRLLGAMAALDEIRSARPSITSPTGSVGYHDTLAVFYVWAVDRLLAAGFDNIAVLWHPLTHVCSPDSWWHADTLASAAARESFVPSTLARDDEPMPTVPTRVLVAA